MQFTLIDRIIELEPHRRLQAVKALSLAEEYLQDHFPRFPVMPGVLMLEALFQASAWLLLKSDDFARPVVLLEEARNIKYADFVTPGNVLTVTVEMKNQDADGRATLRAQGTIDGTTALSGRLIVRQTDVADCDPASVPLEPGMRRHLKEQFQLLYRPAASAVASPSPP